MKPLTRLSVLFLTCTASAHGQSSNCDGVKNDPQCNKRVIVNQGSKGNKLMDAADGNAQSPTPTPPPTPAPTSTPSTSTKKTK